MKTKRNKSLKQLGAKKLTNLVRLYEVDESRSCPDWLKLFQAQFPSPRYICTICGSGIAVVDSKKTDGLYENINQVAEMVSVGLIVMGSMEEAGESALDPIGIWPCLPGRSMESSKDAYASFFSDHGLYITISEHATDTGCLEVTSAAPYNSKRPPQDPIIANLDDY